MNDYPITMKAFITVFTICLFRASLTAQIEDPHITGNVPITFYGRVVDQNNHPVPGVKVRLEVRVGYFTSPTTGRERWDPVSLETDADGNFVLSNTNGSFIQFTSIGKDGYKLLPKQVKEGYMYYPKGLHTDPAKPIVFKMWKKAGAEALVGAAWSGKVACDGTLMTFDLLNGKRAKEGNLQIACTRVPLDIIPRENKRYDYSLQIAVLGGGIQQTEDDFTYLAPEGGYSPKLNVGQKANGTDWIGKVQQEFYIKTAEGHYGRLSVDWYTWQAAPTHFEWDCSINPSGSRNLER